MHFLLVMRGNSFLREAITSFLRLEVAETDVLAVEHPEEVETLSIEEKEATSLILLYAKCVSVGGCTLKPAIDRIKAALPEKPILLFGDETEAHQASRALELGASGYLSASTPADIAKHALPIVASGGIFAPPFIYPKIGSKPCATSEQSDTRGPSSIGAAEPEADVQFTGREREVLDLLGRGLPNKLIAYRLGLQEGTVKVHVRHILKKLNVTSRTQAALQAQRYLDTSL